jgi:hypothetical protein
MAPQYLKPKDKKEKVQKEQNHKSYLQLTHELGGYIRRMHLCAPIENMKNTINTKIVQLSLSATP